MKNKTLLLLFTITLLLNRNLLLGQTTQSAIYDAVGLLNAKNGINAILIPGHNEGFDVVNPITGKIELNRVSSLPPSYKNNSERRDSILVSILARNANLSPKANLDEVKNAYKKNPFLFNIFDPISVSELPDTVIFLVSPKPSGATNIKDNIVNGLSDFMIKRAEQELTLSIFDKFQKTIERYPEFKILFPKTISLIKPIDPYNYNTTLKTIQESLQEDLKNFLQNIPTLYSIPKYQLLNKEVPSLTLLFATSNMVNSIDGKKQLATTLYNLNNQKFLEEKNNYSSFLKITCILSNSMRKKLLSNPENKDVDYISKEEIDNITHGDIKFRKQLALYYIGLLYQQCQNISFSNGLKSFSVLNLLESQKKNYKTTFDLLLETTEKIHQLDTALLVVKNEEKQRNSDYNTNIIRADRFPLYIEIVTNALNYASPIILSDSNKNVESKELYTDLKNYWVPFIDKTVNLTKSFEQKQYSLAINELGDLLATTSMYLESLDKKNKTQLSDSLKKTSGNELAALNTDITDLETKINSIKKMANSGSAVNKATLNDELQRINQKLNDAKTKKEIITWQQKKPSKLLFSTSKILEYAGVLISVSQANNSQEVESILEQTALPPGSSRIKKVSPFNISINSYVGGYFFRTNTPGNGFANTYGLTAPIGLSISTGFKKGGSLSLFGGVLDVGGIIGYKLNNQGAYEQNINLAGLVSPSVHLIYGFPFYFPLSFGVGSQWTTPSTSNSNSITLTPHFNMFIAVDIPFYNLCTTKN